MAAFENGISKMTSKRKIQSQIQFSKYKKKKKTLQSRKKESNDRKNYMGQLMILRQFPLADISNTDF